LSGSRALAAAEQLAERQSDPGSTAAVSETAGLTEGLLRLHISLAQAADRHEALARRFGAGHPGIPMVEVPAAATDIHDIEGLRSVGDSLAVRSPARR
jgi:hypothetical protein